LAKRPSSLGAPVLRRPPVLVSFVYLAACRLFALVVLLARNDARRSSSSSC
jgi:hypothetical protein